MIKELSVKTRQRTQLIDITGEVQKAVKESKINSGYCLVYCPHTTAGITINENADPDVKYDIEKELNKVIPFEDDYAHMEGNSAAHIKSSLIGNSEFLIIEGGRLLLGTWQGIMFCEFDGPRNRRVLLKIQSDS